MSSFFNFHHLSSDPTKPGQKPSSVLSLPLLVATFSLLEELPFASSQLCYVPTGIPSRLQEIRSWQLDILDEVLLALAGGVDGRALGDDLLAAAGQEEDTAEHCAEDTHRELLCARVSQCAIIDPYRAPPSPLDQFSCLALIFNAIAKGSCGSRRVDVRSGSRPCRGRGAGSRRPCLRWC